MPHVVEAIYENGVLKLEQPLPLRDHEKVRITVERITAGSHSIIDIVPVSVGKVLRPLSAVDDVLGEMLEGR